MSCEQFKIIVYIVQICANMYVFWKSKKKEIKFPLFDPSTSFYDLSDFENDCNKYVLQICISLWSCLTWEILLIGHRSQIFYQQPEKPLSGSYQIWATISDKKDTSQWPPFMYEELRLLLLLLQPLLNHWLDELWNIILLYVSESFVP